MINDDIKTPKSDTLYERCKSVLLNPDCDLLVVSMSPDEIVTLGFPLDKFQQAIIDENSHFNVQHNETLLQNITGHQTITDWLKATFRHVKMDNNYRAPHSIKRHKNGSPLKPIQEDINNYERARDLHLHNHVKNGILNVITLGVTPEIVNLNWPP